MQSTKLELINVYVQYAVLLLFCHFLIWQMWIMTNRWQNVLANHISWLLTNIIKHCIKDERLFNPWLVLLQLFSAKIARLPTERLYNLLMVGLMECHNHNY